MLSLIKNRRRNPYQNRNPCELYFKINGLDSGLYYSFNKEYITAVSSNKLFFKKILDYYWEIYSTKYKIKWLKYQVNEEGERVKLPYLLFDKGILYYYPTKEIVGVFIVEDKKLTLTLDLKMVKEEKSLLKIVEYKDFTRDINIIIINDLKVEKKFISNKINCSNFEQFMEKIAKDEN